VHFHSQSSTFTNAAYVIIKLVLSTTPEDGMTVMPKHAGKNILKLKRFLVTEL
jgi:hypothetical protein